MILNQDGSYRIEYEDVLRALGRYLDLNHYQSLTLVELSDGFLVKGVRANGFHRHARLEPREEVLRDAAIAALLEDAYRRRGRALRPADPVPHPILNNHLRYEELLRVIGQLLDTERWHDLVLGQTPGGVWLKARLRPNMTATPAAQIIARTWQADALVRLVEASRSQRLQTPSSADQS